MLLRHLPVLLAVAALCQASTAQTVGNCSPSLGEAYLDVGQVRARILNNGNLFWRGSPHVYNVPKGGPANAVFAAGIWVGGMVGRQLRMAGTTYGPFEFWAGPLDEQGRPPTDCSSFDRIYRVSRADLSRYATSGTMTPDLADWPTGLGAPTLDAAGDRIEVMHLPLAERADRVINLAAGERPDLTGDQMLWWVMNDRGNVHNRTRTPPIGLEVHVSAFAMEGEAPRGYTTFYRYRLFYRGVGTLEDARFGLFMDPDLGRFDDDFVGSDSVLGLGYVYNADNIDDSSGGYGEAPPALGVDFLESTGLDSDAPGVDPEGFPLSRRPALRTFGFYTGGGGLTGDPQGGEDMHNYLQGRWKDGKRWTKGGNGRDFSNVPTNFMFSGMPPAYWSEFDVDNRGTANAPADRRFITGSGPFSVRPGEPVQITLAVITSFGTDNLDSVRKLKEDSAVIQAWADSNFAEPEPPDAPRVSVTTRSGEALLQWTYGQEDNNFGDAYQAADLSLSARVPDRFYRMEGYNVIRFDSATDQEGTIVAVYDIPNGVTRVVEGNELTWVAAEGTDSGIRHHIRLPGLTNYQSYHYGVQAYAYNAFSSPKVLRGPITRVKVTPTHQPTPLTALGEEYLRQSADNMALGIGAFSAEPRPQNVGSGASSVNVIDDAAITGMDYDVELIRKAATDPPDSESGDPPPEPGPSSRSAYEDGLALRVTRSDGMIVHEGRLGASVFGVDVASFDGLSLNVWTDPAGISGFEAISNKQGKLPRPVVAAPTWLDYPGPEAVSRQQQSTTSATWLVVTGQSRLCPDADCSSYETFIQRTVIEQGGWDRLLPYDWEIRFTEKNSYGWEPWTTQSMVKVPFELWRTGIGTPDDPTDDLRLIPVLNDIDMNGAFNLLNADHPASPDPDDPFTDWFYWHLPEVEEPGDTGYQQWVSQTRLSGESAPMGPVTWGRIALMNWDGAQGEPAASGAFNAWLPEPGTTFRIRTSARLQVGDGFSFSTRALVQPDSPDAEPLAIGITPNPYKGASSYEVSSLTDEVRFTNMPKRATIRVFALNGTLITTLVKNSTDRWFRWNLRTDQNLPIASGLYLVHVETEEGDQVIKFGVIKKKQLLSTF